MIEPAAVRAVLKFSKLYKPDRKFHLGDVCDWAAFRSGARGGKDEAAAIGPDLKAGANFILQYAPTDLLIGNHDVRVWEMADHPNAIIAHAAACSRQEFLNACEKSKVKQLVDHYDIGKSWIQLGDTKVLHGFMYNENATRDHAEHFGKCIIAHLHVATIGNGRRSDHPVCYCVGTLANVAAMTYANRRRATSRWSHGFVWGEYSDTECHINLSWAEQGQASNWKLPL